MMPVWIKMVIIAIIYLIILCLVWMATQFKAKEEARLDRY